MGKRRKEGPQADKYNPHATSDEEDEEEIENNLEKEPLKPEEIANIKARKKLIATRRIPSSTAVNGSATVNSSFGFTPFAPFNPPATNTDSENKPSVFSGFKGFMSVSKPAATNSSSTITLTTTTTNTNGTSSETVPRPTLTISESAKPPAANLFTSSITKPSESTASLFKPAESVTSKLDTIASVTTAPSVSTANNLSHSNICETDLNFMNDLNDLYERYYGSIKEKNFTIPSDILNGSDLVFEQESSQDGTAKKLDEEDESKKKYAYLLADLNKHCSKWISKHVEENPLVILTPVFVDYFAYLILLEKNFFPSTFSTKKEKPLNGTNVPASTTTTTTTSLTTSTPSLFKFSSSTNGGSEQTTLTTTAAPSFASTTTKNGVDSDSHKHLNGGFKFGSLATTTSHVNGSSKQEETPKKISSEELAESDEKNLEQSSKTFASLITKTPFSQIPLTTATTTTTTTSTASSFLFKPPSESSSTTDNKKDTTDTTAKETPFSTTPKISLPSQETVSLFKFGQSTSSSSVTTGESKPTATTMAPTEVTTTSTMPKFSMFSSAPTFKFGDLSKPSPAAASAAATTSPSSQQTTSLFSKPAESTSAETTKPSNFFANLSKPPSTTTTSTPAGATLTTSTTASAVPTFSSLLSGTSSSTMFKPFSSSLDQTASGTTTTTSTTTTPSIFSSLNPPSTTGTTTSTPFFSFQSALGPKPSIFGQSAASTPGAGLFSAAAVPASNAGEGEEGEEEYEPPKPEASDVKEEGSVFEKRIKLYYFSEKEKKFSDRGVGNLFLKPINSGESTQLIVRADTSLANILLNVKLTKLFPITKLGAKDVSFICVPNPPIPNVDSKAPCKFLFKVKTEDDAKELLDKLNELKK